MWENNAKIIDEMTTGQSDDKWPLVTQGLISNRLNDK